jgi:signal transduction histidine kinase
MKIKNRLSLSFTLISASVLLVVLVAIYILFYNFARNEFYAKLKDRANVVAQLYLEADEITGDSLLSVKQKYLDKLPEESIQLYDNDNAPAFVKETHVYWDDAILGTIRKERYYQYSVGKRQVVGIYYLDNQGNFVILVSAVDEGFLLQRGNMLKVMAILFVLVSVGLFFTGRWFADRALSPINSVISQMKRIRASNLHYRVNEGKGKDEITQLAKSFNELLEHLENAFEMQKTYVANASHELRTPITSIIGEIEVALQKARNEEEYKQTLHSVLSSSEELKDTVTNLMELAQVDMEFAQPTLSQVNVEELLWQLQTEWHKKNGTNNLVITISHLPEDQSLTSIAANPSLLIIALNNIIGNAFKFSSNKKVICDLFADDNMLRLSVIDKGPGIHEESIQKLFTPFYRGENAKNFSGNGIGLYIAHRIIKLFKGEIRVKSKLNEGATFVVTFCHGK